MKIDTKQERQFAQDLGYLQGYGLEVRLHIGNMADEIDRLHAANAELVEALKGVLICANVRIDDPRITAFDAARAAIAKAEGSK